MKKDGKKKTTETWQFLCSSLRPKVETGQSNQRIPCSTSSFIIGHGEPLKQ